MFETFPKFLCARHTHTITWWEFGYYNVHRSINSTARLKSSTFEGTLLEDSIRSLARLPRIDPGLRPQA